MKKMWMIAAVACAALMISCGGDKKASVEDKGKSLISQLNAAAAAKDEAKFKSLVNEVNGWAEGLSEADCEKFDKLYNELASEDTKAAVNYLQSQQAGGGEY